MRTILAFTALLVILTFSSCAKKDTETIPAQGSQHATVTMKDGTTAAGTVVSSSSKEITLAGDDKITRTIPIDQVRSVEYGEAAPEATAAPSVPEIPATPAASSTPPGSTVAPVKPQPDTGAPAAQNVAPAQPVQKPAPVYELPAGAKISVRNDKLIDSATVAGGQTFSGDVQEDVLDNAGHVVIPARSMVEIVIKSASKGGKVSGASDLVLSLKSVEINEKVYNLETTDISQAGKSGIGANKRTATYTGGGAAVGAVIGAIAGGGKGAAIGAGAGAGAGALTQILTKGSSIKVPAETILTFQLDQPLRVTGR
jgi:hypothetical protein